MHILNSFSYYTVSLFKEFLLPPVNAQQKKIILIASLAFSFLAACYLISRCYLKDRLSDDKKENAVDSKIKPDKGEREVKVDNKKGDSAPLSEKEVVDTIAEAILDVKKEDAADSKLKVEEKKVEEDQSLEVRLTDAAKVKNLSKDIKSLNISHCKDLTDEAIKDLPQELETLCMLSCPSLTDAAIKNLPRNLKKLYLNFQITDAAIKTLPENLEELCMEAEMGKSGPAMTSAAIEYLPKNLKKLFVVEDHNFTHIAFKEWLPALEELNLIQCKNFAVIQDLPKSLKKLNLCGCDITTLNDLPEGLEDLSLSSCNKLTDAAVNNLPKDLKKLDLSFCKNLTAAVIKVLPQDLEELDLSACKITNDIIKDLPRNLKKLNLRLFFNFQDAAIKDLPPGLEELNLENCSELTANGMQDLPKKNLKVLKIEGCYKLNRAHDAAILKDLFKDVKILKY